MSQDPIRASRLDRRTGGSRSGCAGRRGRSRLPLLAALAGVGLLAAPAAADPAESPGPYAFGRYFVGISGITSVATGEHAGDLDPSLGGQVRMGYRLHPNVSLEAAGEWHDRYDFDGDGHYTVWTAGLAARGYPLTGTIQPFGLVGAGIINVHEMGGGSATEDYGFAPKVGIGLDWYLSRDLAVTVDASWVHPVGPAHDFQYVLFTWGLTWY